jgi:Tol biopolymer transport system component
VKPLAAAVAAAVLTGGGAHGTTNSLIVFAADRAPAVSGDVYRADWNGRVANLTHSPWQETNPVVSPNGKLVAFVSDRDGGSVWTIGVSGRGLSLVSEKGFPSEYGVELAWSPDSRMLVYTTGASNRPLETLWLTGAGAAPRAVAHSKALGATAWAPDGRLVTVETFGGAVDAFTPVGKHAWHVPSGGNPVGWSSKGLFAAGAYDGRVRVVGEDGKKRFSVAATSAAWSPDGTKLASVKGHRAEVHTSAGRLVSSEVVALYAEPIWTSTGVVFASAPTSFGLNTIATGTTFAVRNGTHVYTHVIGCDDDGGPLAAIASLQLVAHTRSIVYQSDCVEPFDNLYSVSPDGTGLRRITNVQANEVLPRLSPDRTRIAFGESQYAGLSCKGCPEAVRTIGVDGTLGVTLTSQPDCAFDDSPSWSPDGTQVMYVHSECDSAPDAMLIAAGGGTPVDLHVPAWTLAWGPARIAYANGQTNPTTLWTALPDGTGRQKVAAIADLTEPAWSAEGRLAYLVGTTVFANGTKVVLPFARVKSIAWSPDGTRFLVTARPKNAPTFDLYTVKTDGSGVVRLTSNLDASSADWR